MSIYFQDLFKFSRPLEMTSVGGKAFGLCHWRPFLQQTSEVLLPPSFVIDSDQTCKWLSQIPEFTKKLSDWADWNSAADILPSTIEDLEKKILELPVPADFSENLELLRAPWRCRQIIFRSSFTGEDQSTHSLSGCFESKASDWNAEKAWRAITEVLASSFSRSAMIRILQSGLDPRQMKWAILIQPHLEAMISGTALTHDPQNPFIKKAFVEFSSLSSHAVTSGESFETKTAQEGEILPFAEGIHLWKMLQQFREQTHQPQEIEWLFNEKGLWVLQIRPLASELSRVVNLTTNSQSWTRSQTAERFPEAISTMGWSVIQGILQKNLETLHRRFGIEPRNPQDAALLYRGYVYADAHFFESQNLKVNWFKIFNPLRKRTWSLLRGLIRDILFRRSLSITFLHFLINFLSEELTEIEQRWKNNQNENLHRWEILRLQIKVFQPSNLNTSHLLAMMKEQQIISHLFLEDDLAVFMIKELIQKSLEKIWESHGVSSAELLKAIGSLSFNRTLLMNQELKSLQDLLQKDQGFEAFLARLSLCEKEENLPHALEALSVLENRKETLNFFEKNGHLNTTWDISRPCWREEPRLLLPLLTASASKQGPLSVNSKQQVKSSLATELSGSELFPSQVSPPDRNIIFQGIGIVRSMMEIDEDQHFQTGFLMYSSRQLLLLMEQYLKKQGVLSRTGDIFHLTLEEVTAALEGERRSLKQIVVRRRSEMERNFNWLPPLTLGEALNENIKASLSGLVGLPMSPGLAQGRVMFVNHIHEFPLTSSEPIVLFCRTPNPALTPLFPMIAALVTETGGPLSHGFVSAREYGLPGVRVSSFAELELKGGDWLEVNGSSGELKKI